MAKRLNICTVDTPTQLYVKAQALLEDDVLTVLDRRGIELFTVEAQAEEVTRHITRYGDTTVRDMPGACACGGLRIVPKSEETS